LEVDPGEDARRHGQEKQESCGESSLEFFVHGLVRGHVNRRTPWLRVFSGKC